MKIVSILGARPQFIKAAPVSKALREAGHQEFLVHTGQHYDYGMLQVFFEELNIPEPDVNLNVGSGSHGWQTGQMLIGIEKVLLAEKPDWLLAYGVKGKNVPLRVIPAARAVNDSMPLHVVQLLQEALASVGKILLGRASW